jgi:hypothetical protein
MSVSMKDWNAYSSVVVNSIVVGGLLSGIAKCSFLHLGSDRPLIKWIVAGATCLALSLLIDAHSAVTPAATASQVGIFSGYVQMAGVLITLYVLVIRARVAELTVPKIKHLTTAFAAFVITCVVIVRIVNTVNDAAAINGIGGVVSSDARQILRYFLNFSCLVAVCYLEGYITSILHNTITGGDVSHDRTKIIRFGWFYATVVMLLFFTQGMLQLMRRFYPGWTYAPMYGMAWYYCITKGNADDSCYGVQG